jgi:hypothetical protein
MGQEIQESGDQASPAAEQAVPDTTKAPEPRPEAAIETQRVRNTAAMMRAHRKVARERIVRSPPH